MYLQTTFSFFVLMNYMFTAVYTNVWKYELHETMSESLSLCAGVSCNIEEKIQNRPNCYQKFRSGQLTK